MEPEAGPMAPAPLGCTPSDAHMHGYIRIPVYNKYTHKYMFVPLCAHGYKYSLTKYNSHLHMLLHVCEQSQDSQEKTAGFNWLMEILLGTFISSE